MPEPKRSRPYWPDAMQNASGTTDGLKAWSWASERFEKSRNYWIATSRPEGRPHLMIVWGIWWDGAYWFTTGRRTRKAKNLAAYPYCVIGTEMADEAVIVEGAAEEISDREIWKQVVDLYNRKYGGDVGPLLETSNSSLFRVEPQTVFAQDEHAENFAEAVTRWTFSEEKPL